MEVLISAVAGDLASRFISFLTQSYSIHHARKDDVRKSLECVLLRMHTIVEEAEGRHITNRGMLLQLKTLVEGMYLGYYMLDRLKLQSLGEEIVEDAEVSHQSQSSTVSTFNTGKRLRLAAAAITKNAPIVFGTGSKTELKGVLENLEGKVADMREFVMLLCNCPRLPPQPYSTYLYMDKCMFGRHVEKEQAINYLLCNDSHDRSNFSILPIIGPRRIGKRTLVQHVCKDERVRGCFPNMFFFKGDDLRSGEFAVKCKAASASGKSLFVIEFSWDVDEAAWENFRSYLQKVPGTGSKIVVIGTTQQIANLGTAQPIRMKSLSPEEYWYYFKVLCFGSLDPDEHPKLAALGMQLATLLQGSFLGANILGEILRANPNAQFWCSIVLSIRELVRKHLSSFATHPEDLLERNVPVNFAGAALVGGQAQGYLVYDMREAGPAQSELPKLTSQELLTGRDIPVQDKFDVLVWRSRIPPYSDYVVTYEKQKPRRIIRKKNHLSGSKKITAERRIRGVHPPSLVY